MRIGFLFIILFALNSCKSDQAPEKTPHLFADYYVRYLETERQLKAHAAFYEGDSVRTARPVQFNSTVRFQGDPMNPRHLSPNTIRYIYNGGGNYTADGFTFQYEDLNGKNQQQVLQMAPIEDFSITGEASHSKGLSLNIKSAPFRENESLVLFFTNVSNNQAYSLEYKGVIDIPLLIAPGELEGITPGKHVLYLIKKQMNTLKVENMDITSSIEFYSKTIEIPISK
jgi:hypothetical protein